MNKIKSLIGLALCALALTGCKTTRIDPTTGQTTKEFDPVKTAQIKAALEPIGSSAVRRVIKNSPEHSAEIAGYFRAVGSAFCQMSEKGDFDPAYLVGAVDTATAKLQEHVPGEAIEIKNALIACYKIGYEGRFRAELPADQWPKNVADLICACIDQGLKDTGRPGARTVTPQPET